MNPEVDLIDAIIRLVANIPFALLVAGYLLIEIKPLLVTIAERESVELQLLTEIRDDLKSMRR